MCRQLTLGKPVGCSQAAKQTGTSSFYSSSGSYYRRPGLTPDAAVYGVIGLNVAGSLL